MAQFLTMKEAAARAGVQRTSFYGWARKRGLEPQLKDSPLGGQQYFIDVEELAQVTDGTVLEVEGQPMVVTLHNIPEHTELDRAIWTSAVDGMRVSLQEAFSKTQELFYDLLATLAQSTDPTIQAILVTGRDLGYGHVFVIRSLETSWELWHFDQPWDSAMKATLSAIISILGKCADPDVVIDVKTNVTHDSISGWLDERSQTIADQASTKHP